MNKALNFIEITITVIRSMSLILRMILLGLMLAYPVSRTTAQTGGAAPPNSAPGNPAGSYQLNGFESINLFNGNLNFSLPLLQMGGRGGVQFPISVNVNSGHWKMERDGFTRSGGDGGRRCPTGGSSTPGCITPPTTYTVLIPGQKITITDVFLPLGPGPIYTTYEHVFPGTQIFLDGSMITNVGEPTGSTETYYHANPNGWKRLDPGYGPGVMEGRTVKSKDLAVLTRLIFTDSNGTEYELRDRLTYGRRHTSASPVTSRGSVFISADGSGLTFASDTEIPNGEGGLPDVEDGVARFTVSGHLLFPDGTRYRVKDNKIDWIRDRNGNFITFEYDANGQISKATDTMDRIVNFTYNITPNADNPDVNYDEISFKGWGGVPRAIKVWHSKLREALREDHKDHPLTYGRLFPAHQLSPGEAETVYNPGVIKSIELPDGRHYKLLYDPHKHLARVELPTGGAIEYDQFGIFTPLSAQVRVKERRVYNSNGRLEKIQTYGDIQESAITADPITTTITVEEKQAGSNEVLTKEKHHFYGHPSSLHSGLYSPWREGKEFKTEIIDTKSNVTLRTVHMEWKQRPAGNSEETWGDTYVAGWMPPRDPRLVETLTTLDNGLVSKKTSIDSNDQNDNTKVRLDRYNNPTEIWEYDFGAGQPGPLLRYTHTKFVDDPAYVGDFNNSGEVLGTPHLRRLPKLQQIYSFKANKAILNAETQYFYDQYDQSPVFNYNLSTIKGWSNPGERRGNVTTLLKLTDTNTTINNRTEYDQFGNVIKSIDPKGNVTQIDYTDRFTDNINRNSFGFPSSVISPVPDASGKFALREALVTRSVYDFSTGLVVSSMDPNDKMTKYEYKDILDRLTKVTKPDGSWTSFDYKRDDTGDFIVTKSLLDASGNTSETQQYFDGLGRAARTFLRQQSDEPEKPWLTTDIEYDALGRIVKKSLPYRSTENHSKDPSFSGLRWMSTVYDSLGRVREVKNSADNAWVRTDYKGNSTTVEDSTGKKTRRLMDALGRIIRADEPDATGNLGEISNPAQPTLYTYDALGNLRKVDQGGQLRYFMYDFLGRLIRVKNPEQDVTTHAEVPSLTDPITQNAQWASAFTYDSNSNIKTRIDALNRKTEYGYDNLNRNITVRYSDGTKDIDKHYDGAINGRGLFYYFNWENGDNTRYDTHLAIDAYDVMGRPIKYRQHFYTNGVPSPEFTITRAYNPAGNVISEKYPSGNVVNYDYDSVGRLKSFTGNLGDGVVRTYSNEIAYSELGAMKQERFGTDTPVYNKRLYNSREQLAEIRASTFSLFDPSKGTDWNRGGIINYYSSAQDARGASGGGPDNNGNLKKQDVFIPHDDQNLNNYSLTSSFYEYDHLNRLDKTWETQGDTVSWTQDYDYDRWGNRTINQNNTSGAGINNTQFDKRSLSINNRLYAPGDMDILDETKRKMQYDKSGNLTRDIHTGKGTYSYDAENRMIQAETSRYTYDANGRRVKRNVSGQETWQVYGMDGELIAEYAANASPASPQKEYGYRNGEMLISAPGKSSNAPVTQSTPTLKIAPASVDASSTYSNAVPANATDGNTTTNWIANGFPGQWIQQDLGGSYALQKIRLNAVQSSSGFTSHEIYGGATPTTLRLLGTLSGNTQNGQWLELTKTATDIRYVQVKTISSPSWVAWSEFEVYGTPTPQKIAPSSVTASNSYSTNVPTNAADGNLSTYWNSGGYPVQWIQQNLGKPYDLQKIRLNILQSPAGNTVHEVYGGETANDLRLLGTLSGYTQAGQWLELTTTATNIRYVKVQTTSSPSSWVAWHEFEVYGSPIATPPTSPGISWLIADQLGTPRMVIDKTGSLEKVTRHDYLPFGEELVRGVGGRTDDKGYTNSDGTRQKFTGYERDTETNLDYAQARYYSNIQGRFTGVDPLLASGSPVNPQTWNRYSYCINDPIQKIDPSGMNWVENKKNGSIHWSVPGSKIDPETHTILTGKDLQYNISATESITLFENGPDRKAQNYTDASNGWSKGAFIPGARGFTPPAESQSSVSVGVGPVNAGIVWDGDVKFTLGVDIVDAEIPISFQIVPQASGKATPGLQTTANIGAVVGITASAPTNDPGSFSVLTYPAPDFSGMGIGRPPTLDRNAVAPVIMTPGATIGLQYTFPAQTEAQRRGWESHFTGPFRRGLGGPGW